MPKRYPATILATCCIPWDETGAFDEDTFRRQIQTFLHRGVKHLYLFGTAGEGYAMTDQLYEQIVTAFADEMNGPDRYPMIGQIHLSLPVMLQRLQRAYDLGIRDFQVALPSWGALSDQELQTFFHTICSTYSDCRFMHYNLARAKRMLTPDEYFQLAEAHPNFVGAKFTTSDLGMIHALVSTPSPLQFFLGETGYAIGSMFGECGLLISIANTNLERAWQLVEAGVQRDYPKLIQFVHELKGVAKGLVAATDDPKIDGAYDKLLFRMVDPQFPLRMLPPYSANTEAQADQYRSFLQERFPQWLEASEV
jgi:dihydrodipicolinate synthase/N-acetylneuraminate lyase